MLKKIVLMLLLGGFLLCPPGETISKNARKPARERLDISLKTLAGDASKEEKEQALDDLVRFCYLNQNQEVFNDILTENIAKCTDDGLKQKLELSKAQILAASNWVEAKSIFDRARKENWPKATTTYLETMTKAGKNKERAIEEFNSCYGKPDYLDYRGRKEDLSVLMAVLRFAKEDDAKFSALNDVFPNLIVTDKDPVLLEILRALCIGADGNYKEAIQMLETIDNQIAGKKEYEETYKILPLYTAWIGFIELADLDKARKNLDIFWSRNTDDPGHVLGRVLRIAYDYERTAQSQLKLNICEVTSWLLSSEMNKNSQIKAAINAEYKTNSTLQAKMPAELFDHVLEVHAYGLSWRGQWDEAVKIWDQLIEKYYPNNITGACAMMSKATCIPSIYSKNQDDKAALAMVKDILEKAPYDEILIDVTTLLGEYSYMLGNHQDALAAVKEIYDLIPPNPRGQESRGLKEAQDLEIRINKSIQIKKDLDDMYKRNKEKAEFIKLLKRRGVPEEK